MMRRLHCISAGMMMIVHLIPMDFCFLFVCVKNNNNGEDVHLDKDDLQQAVNQANLEASTEYKSEYSSIKDYT
jgi:hypothetical protein